MGDTEAAEYLLRSNPDLSQPKGDGRPDLIDMTLSNQLLMRVVDELQAQNARLDAIGGVKPGPVHPMRRPLTGIEKARRKLEDQHIEALIGEAYAAMENYGVNNGE